MAGSVQREPWLGGIRGKPEGSSVEHGRPIVCHEWGQDKGHELWRWQATLSRASIKLVPLGRTGKCNTVAEVN